MAIVAALQVYFAHRYYGFIAGDDVELLEEAFRRAIGLPHEPWDIRNLFVSDVLVAPFVFIAHTFGITDRATLIEIATLPFIAISLVTIVLVFDLTWKWTGDDRAAIAAALLFAFHWIPLAFGSTPYPRTLATACIVCAALIIDRHPVIAGLLAALAFADRFSEIVFLAPLLIIARARWRVFAGALIGIVLIGGIYDWITWGAPFRSLIRFAHLTIVAPDFASRVKYQSPMWYFSNIGRWCAPTLLILIAVDRRAMRWSFVVIPLVALSVIRHKELRYLQVVIPFLAIAAGMGFATLWQAGRRFIAGSLLIISLLWNVYGIRILQRKSMPAVIAARAIDHDPRIRDVAVPQAWAFGDMLYFHRPVTLREVGTPPREIPNVDAIAIYETDLDVPAVLPAGFVRRATFRDGPARAVALFTRAASGTSDPTRR